MRERDGHLESIKKMFVVFTTFTSFITHLYIYTYTHYLSYTDMTLKHQQVVTGPYKFLAPGEQDHRCSLL